MNGHSGKEEVDAAFQQETLRLLSMCVDELAAICKRLGGIHEKEEEEHEADESPGADAVPA